jgi:hypothetical protein
MSTSPAWATQKPLTSACRASYVIRSTNISSLSSTSLQRMIPALRLSLAPTKTSTRPSPAFVRLDLVLPLSPANSSRVKPSTGFTSTESWGTTCSLTISVVTSSRESTAWDWCQPIAVYDRSTSRSSVPYLLICPALPKTRLPATSLHSCNSSLSMAFSSRFISW